MKHLADLIGLLFGIALVTIGILGVVSFTHPTTKCLGGYLYLNRNIPVQLFDAEQNPIYCLEK